MTREPDGDAGNPGSDETEGGPAGPATPAPPAAPQRPRPAYGEYAPEGWSWAPPGTEAAGHDAGRAPAAAATPGSGAARPSAGPLPGVPHNLGVPGARQQAPVPGLAAPDQAGTPDRTAAPIAPAAATTPSRDASTTPAGGPADHYRATTPPDVKPPRDPRRLTGGRLADRIITIALLVFGAFGALNIASALNAMPAEFRRLAQVLEVNDVTVPAAVGTLGVVGALVIFALYAVNLIFSLQRLRARKLAFWVPLVTAILAFIVSTAFTLFGVAQVPELLQAMSDPSAFDALFGSLAAPPAP